MMDPDYCEDDGFSEGDDGEEEYIFDTFDRVIDESELDAPDPEGDSGMSSEHWGMAFALADEIADERKEGDYDLDERTDGDNFHQAMKQNPPTGDKELPKFEQIVQDICQGRRSLFDYNY
jgi:hypothetical protein